MPTGFDRVLRILLGIPEKEVGKVIAGIVAIKVKLPLGISEIILDLLIKSPAPSELELMRAFCPGNIVAKLIIVRFINPWRPVGCVVCASAAIQVNRRNAVACIRASKQSIEGKARWS